MQAAATSLPIAFQIGKLIFMTEMPSIRMQPGKPRSEDTPIGLIFGCATPYR